MIHFDRMNEILVFFSLIEWIIFVLIECYRSLNEKLGNCLKSYNTFYAKSYANIFKDFD